MEHELSVFVGYDSKAAEAFDVCRYSIRRHASRGVPIMALRQTELRELGVYDRPLDTKASNEFSMTRWLTPFLSQTRYALFLDSDMLFTGDIFSLLPLLDPGKAVHVVKHDYTPCSDTKMSDNGVHKQQYAYPRKNWSSFVIWNCEHPKVAQVTPEMVNSAEPWQLHRFSFLEDDDIGDIGCWAEVASDHTRVPMVNFLVGEYSMPEQLPLVLHYTLAIPGIHDEAACSEDFYDRWIQERTDWACDRDRSLPMSLLEAA